MNNRVAELRKDMFLDTIIFSFSEPGAMGPNDATYYKRTGESFSVDYKSDETPYKELREVFPLMKECRWFGPMKSEVLQAPTIVIGGSRDDPETRVPKGWRHIYLDYGNHLAVKEEYYSEVKKIFSEYDNCEITFEWPRILEKAKFAERTDEIISDYNEQRKRDEVLAKVLTELQNNAEYIREIAEAPKGDMDKLMEIFGKYSGIKMDWFELKQFGLRRAGVL